MGLGQGMLAVGILFTVQLDFLTVLLAALIASIYWDAMIVACLFPDTAWVDPEFAAETPRPFELYPQQLIGYVLLLMLIFAVGFAFVLS